MTTQEVASAPAQVSAEDYQKLTAELDTTRSDLVKATEALADVAQREQIRTHFKGEAYQAKGVDPDVMATLTLPHVRGVEAEELGGKLDALVASLPLGTPATEGEPAVPDQPTPVVAHVPNPNPGAGGEQPPMEAIKYGDAEFTKLAREGGLAGIKQAKADGRYVHTPQGQAVLDGTNSPI